MKLEGGEGPGPRAAVLLQLLPDAVAQEGFSSSTLQLYLGNIRERNEKVRAAIYDRLDAMAWEGTIVQEGTLTSLRSILGATSSRKQQDATKLLRAIEEHSTAASLVQAARSEVARLEVQAGRHRRLEEIRRHTAAGNFSVAATGLQEMKNAIAPTEEGEAGQVSEVGMEVEEVEAELKKAVASWCRSAVSVGAGKRMLEVLRPDESPEGAWRALDVLGLIASHVRKLADGLMTIAIRPIVLERGAKVVVDSGCLQVLNADDAEGSAAPSVAEACKELQKVVDFTYQRVAGGSTWVSERLGENLWPRLAKGVEAKLLVPLEPTGATSLAAFRRAAAAACDLEAQAQAASICPQGLSPLHSYVEGVLEGFTKRRVQALLSEARTLVIAPLGGDVVEAGKPHDAPFLTQQDGDESNLFSEGLFKVTAAGDGIPRLMEAALQEAVAAERAEDAAALCGAVEGMATILGALPPVVHFQQLKVPQLAALYHNDCKHVAAAAATLPLAYAHCLGGLTGSKISFMEAAVALRASGQDALDSQLAAQREQLMELLDGAQGFNLYKQMAGLSCRKAISAAVHSLKRASSVVRGVLSTTAFIRFSGQLLQAACSRVAHELLSKQDYSLEESEELPVVLLPLVEEAPLSILGLSGTSTAYQAEDEGTSAEAVMLAALKASAPAWARLKAVVGLLRARLADIAGMWESGELVDAGLRAGEVKHMITALFEDTVKRDEQLRRIVG